jgi:hypothetical protein
MPALPLDEAGKYVVGAYIVFFALIAIYVAIMAARLQRLQRDLAELDELAARRERGASGEAETGTPMGTAPAADASEPEEARVP